MDDFDESSIHNGWVDETKDHNGLMLLNDKDHQDEQHLLFLQDIGSAANISRGDSISLFAKLADGMYSPFFAMTITHPHTHERNEQWWNMTHAQKDDGGVVKKGEKEMEREKERIQTVEKSS